MWPRFGIKIGNSTLCIASVKVDEKIEVMANKQGDRVSDAVLYAEMDEIEVGATAKQKISSKPSKTISNSFQFFLPRDFLTEEKIEEARKHITCKFNEELHLFELAPRDDTEADQTFSPFTVSMELFRASYELARQCYFEEDFAPPVVLSIPHYYPHQAWTDLADSAEAAGFHVAQVITEPTAAVLAYEIGDNNNGEVKRVLFIKCGGLLSSFTLFEITDGLYSVAESSDSFYIGGTQFTEALVKFIAKEFRKKYHIDPNESFRSMAKIRSASDTCKHILTSLPSMQIYIDSLIDGIDFNIQMSRARFESIIQPVLNDFLSVLNVGLAKLNPEDRTIHEIVLAGATMKIPKMQTLIATRFPEAKLNISFPPDEVVAIGCAKQATFINPSKQDLEWTTKCACLINDIFVWHDNNMEGKQIAMKKGCILPAKAKIDVEKCFQITGKKQKKQDNDNDDEENDSAVFYIESGGKISKISLNDAKAIAGFYTIEVCVGSKGDASSVTLKCR